MHHRLIAANGPSVILRETVSPHRITTAERAAAEAGEARDRDLRERHQAWRARGVVHTPPEIARHVVSRADRALRTKLALEGGLADRRVAVLDPACGPGVFLAAALAAIPARRLRAHGPPHAFLGLDVDPNAIVDAERVLRAEAEALRIPLTLHVSDTLANLTPFGFVTDGAHDEGHDDVAEDDIAVVVLGNPPWAGRTANRGAEVTNALLEDFRLDDDGVRLDERKLGVLSDDYVRFFRWSAEIVRRAPRGGVVALVTNASFLDGVVHRGMRAALTRWFDGIEVIDLGGSALVAQGETTDENVFGVRPSVAITVAWREPGLDAIRRARVHHAAILGSRAEKLARLAADEIELTPVRAARPGFLFRPRTEDPVWVTWPALDTAMPFNAEGVQTNRDDAVIDRDKTALLERLYAFAEGRGDPRLDKAREPSAHYDPRRSREAVAEALGRDPRGDNGLIRRIAYRPFDTRFFATVTPFCHRPRRPLLAAIDEATPVLLSVRKDRGKVAWTHFGASLAIPDNCFLSARSSCRTRAFPTRDADGRDNLDPTLREAWSTRLGLALDPLDFLRYALSVLASPTYRARFDDALHLSYPRIPPPADAATFRRGVQAGAALVAAFGGCDPIEGDGAAGKSDDADQVWVGHHRVRSGALHRAIAEADHTTAEILAALD